MKFIKNWLDIIAKTKNNICVPNSVGSLEILPMTRLVIPIIRAANPIIKEIKILILPGLKSNKKYW